MIPIIDISELLLALGISSSPTEDQRAVALMALNAASGAIRRYLKYDPTYAARTEYYPGGDTAQGGRSVWEANDTHAYERMITSASSTELQVLHTPIRAISDLRVDYDGRAGTQSGAFGSATQKTEGTDFWANFDSVDSDGNKYCRDGIIRSHGLWPNTPGSVKITYTAGYKAKELRGEDTKIDATGIWEACLDEATRRFLKIQSRRKTRAGWAGPLTSESLGDYSYSADSAMLSRLMGGTDLLPENREKLEPFLNYGAMLLG